MRIGLQAECRLSSSGVQVMYRFKEQIQHPESAAA